MPPKGYKFSAESRRKMSESAKGNTKRRGAVLTSEQRQRISDARRGWQEG